MGSHHPEFNVRELTISHFHAALRTGQTTCEQVTAFYLSQISTHDPTLKAVIHVNPYAENQARSKDAETIALLATGANFPPLHGVPIILKDTYATAEMPTTAGSISLKTLQTSSDAFVVQKLRAAGGIILAKANLHELSMQGITVSSLRGQTLNPYDLTRTPGGSSGGTAAALAANMGLVGCGGDTMNSLRSPASACCIVGFRPTAGQVSRSGTVPVSMTQDTLGPMGRTVRDVRVLFEVMRGEDPEDPITLDPNRYGKVEEARPISTTTTTTTSTTTTTTQPPPRLRIGILENYFGNPTDTHGSEISTVTKTILSALHKTTPFADLIPISLPSSAADTTTLLSTADVQSYEFRTAIDSFLQSPLVQHTPHRSLDSIARSGEYMREALSAPFFETLRTDVFNTSSPEYKVRLGRIAALKRTLRECFEENGLDALAYPHQRHLVVKVGPMVQPGRNGILAALTGGSGGLYSSPPTDSAPLGVPIGLELLGRPWRDLELLDIAEGRRDSAG